MDENEMIVFLRGCVRRRFVTNDLAEDVAVRTMYIYKD